jgi:hypothetical protein
LRDWVVATIDEENSAFLGAENARSPAVEMAETTVSEDDSVLRRDHPIALGARRGLLVSH